MHPVTCNHHEINYRGWSKWKTPQPTLNACVHVRMHICLACCVEVRQLSLLSCISGFGGRKKKRRPISLGLDSTSFYVSRSGSQWRHPASWARLSFLCPGVRVSSSLLPVTWGVGWLRLVWHVNPIVRHLIWALNVATAEGQDLWEGGAQPSNGAKHDLCIGCMNATWCAAFRNIVPKHLPRPEIWTMRSVPP